MKFIKLPGRLLHGLLMVGALAALGAFAACSLGEGVTPECSPDPTASNACDSVADCDSGSGFIKAEDRCCLGLANFDYNQCAQERALTGESADFRQLCPTAAAAGGAAAGGGAPVSVSEKACSKPADACAVAAAAYSECMAGRFSAPAGGSGGTAAGGAGGSGGSSAGGSGGSSAGGSSGGNGGAGGA